MAQEIEKNTNQTAVIDKSVVSTPVQATKREAKSSIASNIFVVRIKHKYASCLVFEKKIGLNTTTSFNLRIGGGRQTVSLYGLYEDTILENYDRLGLSILDCSFLEQYVEVEGNLFNDWIESINNKFGNPLTPDMILSIQTAYADPSLFKDNIYNSYLLQDRAMLIEAEDEVYKSYSK